MAKHEDMIKFNGALGGIRLQLKLVFILFAIASTSGFGQSKEFSFVFLHKKADGVKLEKAESDKIMEGHMANINRLAAEGKLISAGPFDGGGGLFILNTTSINEARQWLSTDPGVQAQRWNIEILPYKPLIRGACAVKEPYEMVMYQFIRYHSKGTSKDIKDLESSLQKDDNVITHGSFSDKDGIFVLKNKVTKEVLDSYVAVKSGRITLDIKDLYIAKGGFCE